MTAAAAEGGSDALDFCGGASVTAAAAEGGSDAPDFAEALR